MLSPRWRAKLNDYLDHEGHLLLSVLWKDNEVLRLSKKFLSENNEVVDIDPLESRCDSLKTVYVQALDKGCANTLSIALVSPDDQRRSLAARALDGLQVGMIREYREYPTSENLLRMMEMNFDAVIIELDSSPVESLELIERICSNSFVTVMVFTAHMNAPLIIKCMRAGAREFLTEPLVDDSWAEALERTSVRRPVDRPGKKAIGRLHVFFGSKGGAGVTTIASNFAVLLGRESGRSALLIDLDLPLGNAALALGVSPKYSTVDALQNVDRLDSRLLSKLLCSYSPTLSVLGAPGKFTNMEVSNEAVDKLMAVTRQEFEHVVVDSGSRLDLINTKLFEEAATLYLVTGVCISELRNANCLVSKFFAREKSKLEVVLNRYTPSVFGIDQDQITKFLTTPARWKIPDDHAAAQLAQNTSTPLVVDDSPISRMIRQMARAACNMPVVPERRKRTIGLF